MTNIDRAAGIIRAMVKIENPTHDTDVTQALADAGLLIPDLPGPTDRSVPEWESPSNEHHAVSVNQDGTVRIWGATSGYTPKESRDLALALLAAADYAERNQA